MTTFNRFAVILADAVENLIWLALVFAALALLVKGRDAVRAAGASASESRVNLVYYLTDAAAINPLLSLLAGAVAIAIQEQGFMLVSPDFWTDKPAWLALLAGIMVADFVGYWRHRMMHCAVLWPAHAVHHSDRELTWLSLIRFHPINRLLAVALGVAALALLGIPPWVVVANSFLRNWYGHFIHADLPWTYGPVVGRIFVSPVLHRWHHTRDIAYSGNNFATIFAFYDLIFGTWRCPSVTVGDLGIDDHGFPQSWAGQIIWPFRVWLGLAPKPDAVTMT